MNDRTLRQLRETGCEIRTDALSRHLYATDASIYQVLPEGVALPKHAQQAAAVLRTAQEAGLEVTPRGAGTGLAGAALGRGLIVDCARHNRAISEFNAEARTVRVGAGVVLDQLNAFLRPHGLCYGPDVATSSRATLGGMINNNSSGARTPYYGTTIDHVHSLEVVLPDGRIADVGRRAPALAQEEAALDALLQAQTPLIRARFHDGIIKRWPGYGLDRYLRDGNDLSRIFGGSEGTLGVVFSAVLKLVPIPREKGLGLIFFASVNEAMQATVELLDLKPAAIEHIDDVLFEQTRGQLQFAAARDLLELDEKPCKSILIVEFYDDVQDKIAAFQRKNLGLRKLVCKNEAEMGHVWNLRKSGLSLLTGCKGAVKPTAGVEDVAVPPQDLPGYVAGLQEIMKPLGVPASFYGHAASGLLHVRPVVDLHKAEDLVKFRRVAEEVAALTKQYKGALAAEHGVGIARTEFMEDQLGPEMIALMRAVKQVLDPKNTMNPGKILSDGRYRFDTNLRWGAGYEIRLPFAPVLAFAAKDESFIGNLEQCNGCGGCRKLTPTMCPTFLATGEDLMSTRGRANTIRATLDGRFGGDPLAAAELDAALDFCLSCKACKSECPSNVDMALLKAELLHARHRRDGVPMAARFLSRVDRLGEIGSRLPGLTNALLNAAPLRMALRAILGIATARPLPPYAAERFDRWFARRGRNAAPAARGTVILWDDCFVRYHEPHIGRAAVRVLEAAGYEVILPENRACCGRPAFSTGRLDLARDMGDQNAQALRGSNAPVVFLEPSCYSMFKEDYRELGVSNAAALSRRAVLFEHLIERLLEESPDALRLRESPRHVAVHVHCHAKALTDGGTQARLLRRIPGHTVTQLETGCCGMAGAFGAAEKTYSVSMQLAGLLDEKIKAQPPGTGLCASGTSCRHQIEHLGHATPKHVAELLAEALG